MKQVFVVVEHRRGELRDTTYETLTLGKRLGSKIGGELTAVLLGKDAEDFARTLSSYANKVFYVEDEQLTNFNSEVYQIVLSELIKKENPTVTIMGHTAFGIDLLPALATELNFPLATDCVGLDFEDSKLYATRQMYGGKLNTKILLKESPSYLATIRQASFPAEEGTFKGEVVRVDSPLTEEIKYRKFVEYVEAAVGEVDITQADIVVAVGRGIKEKGNLPIVEELASSLGGVVACSRPIVDAGWLPKDRQVGSSGKTVKPKLYIAIGISGAFQHISGMKGAETIVAINKDPNAPIFGEADYGIVGDLFKMMPAIKGKISGLKG